MICFLPSMQLSEWLLVIVLILLLFGAPRIPQLMRGMGQGIKEFKKGMKDEPTPEKEAKDAATEKDTTAEKRDESGKDSCPK